MLTLATDIAGQMQGAVDELERAFDLLNELGESAQYGHIAYSDLVRLRCRLDTALALLSATLPAMLESTAK